MVDIVPNLLFGLREGLGAGLVVSILLAAARVAALAHADDGQAHDGQTRKISAAPIWLGVLGAVMLSGCSAAVLASSTDVASSQVQNAVSGLLSVFAVGLVTAMIFWMRGSTTSLKAQRRGDGARVAPIRAGALTVTAFLAVSREGLQTTLFLWTTARAPGQTAGPLAGIVAGLVAAVVLCWLLYRGAVKLNVAVFFNRAALALIVIAAGMLASGLGNLQDAGLLPGQRWIAFDLAARAPPGVLVGLVDHRGHRPVAEDDRASGCCLDRLPGCGHPGIREGRPPRCSTSHPGPVAAAGGTATVGDSRDTRRDAGPRRRHNDRSASSRKFSIDRGGDRDCDPDRVRAGLDLRHRWNPDVHGRQPVRAGG